MGTLDHAKRIRPLVLLALTAFASGADDAVQQAYQKLAAEHADAVVTVKCVLKLKLGGLADQESEVEAGGLMIEPEGLVLVSNTQLGGFAGMIQRLTGRDAQVSAVPTDLKVLVGEDTEGLAAELLARDSELDLAWVRIKDPSGRRFSAVDCAQSAKPRLGETLLTVSRLGKFFDRAPVVSDFRLAGFTTRPRRLYVPAGGSGNLGAPVYTLDGGFVGVTILQMPQADDQTDLLAVLSQADEGPAGLILPAEEIATATRRARESAPQGAGAAPGGEPAPTTGPAQNAGRTPD